MPALKLIESIISQTVGDRSEIDDILKPVLFYQRLLGQQVLDPKWTWKSFGHYQIFHAAIFIYVLFGTLSVINHPETNTDLIVEGSYTMLLIFICPFKLVFFLSNRFIFRKLYVMVKTEIFAMIQRELKNDVKKILKTTFKIEYILLSMVLIPFLVYEMVIVWNYANGNRVWLSISTDTLLPMTSPFFEVCWLLHSLFFMQVCSTVAPLDMWFAFFMYFFCLATDCLVKMLNVEARKPGESDTVYVQRLNRCLKIFYDHHVIVVDFYRMLTQMYKWLALLPLINAALSICIVLLVLTEGLNIRFAPHILPLFGEVFAYSWFGEQMKTKIDGLKKALFNFDWTSLDRKDIKKYNIIMCYVNKEFGIKTAIGHDLSLITMTTVLKCSYQAFTMLQTTK